MGATAVKQYGWYYTLKGNHRNSYRTSHGVCYDVRDDTNDQLFRPEHANPTARQRLAVAVTWGLTLHKNGHFFLTGYRSGDHVPCASDANGWKIYATSAIDCAKRGWGRQRIQEAYLSPHLQFIWTDSGPSDVASAPRVSKPSVKLLAGARLGTATAQVSWTGHPGKDAISSYRLQHRVDNGRWKDVQLPDKTATDVAVTLRLGHRHRFRVSVRDDAGRKSGFSAGPTLRPALTQAGKANLKGPWWSAHDPRASGGITRYTHKAGSTASLAFTGRGIAVVAPEGPNGGRARIFVNGVKAADIDLGAPTERARTVVFTQTWARVARRSIRIQVLDMPGGDRVDVDAFLILH